MIYKVWVQIEEIDETQDHYENISEPVDIKRFDTQAEAEAFVKGLETHESHS